MAKLKPLVRTLLTLALLGWLLAQIDLRHVGAIAASAHPGWLVAATLFGGLTIFPATWRWQVLLRACRIDLPFTTLLRVGMAGAFFSMFLPSSIGGDLLRMLMIAPDLRRREDAVSTVLLDRLIGMAVTIGVGLVAVLLLPGVWSNRPVLAALGLAVVACAVGTAALFSRGLLDLLGRVTPGFIWRRAGPLALRVNASLNAVGRQPGALLGAAAIAGARQLMICCSTYCAGVAFGMAADPVAYFVLIPIGLALTALPITINGFGLQDNALVLLLAGVGFSAAQAITLSLFLHAVRNLVGLVGGLVFALSGDLRRAARSAPAAAHAPAD